MRVFTDNMRDVLKRVYDSGGTLKTRSLRRLGVSTVKALERRRLITVEYSREKKVWILKVTGRGLKVARKLRGV